MAMPRKKALAAIQSAAAMGDLAHATRIYIENRISRQAYDEAVAKGRALARFVAARDAMNATSVSANAGGSDA